MVTILGLAMIVGACGGNGDSGSTSPIVGTWKRVKSESRVGTAAWAEDPKDACYNDDVEVYGADGKYELFPGTLRCGAPTSTSDTSSVRGTWRLAAGDTKIVYTYEGIPGEYDSAIENLGSTQLIRSWSTLDTKGTQARATYEKSGGSQDSRGVLGQ